MSYDIIKIPSITIWLASLLVIGLQLLLPAQGLSCPIPVFRFALEYWDTDDYHLEIWHHNPFSSEQEELVNSLLGASSGNEMQTNLEVRSLDLEADTDNIPRHSVSNVSPAGFPWMVLRYPRISGITEVLWSGHFNRENVDRLLHSPVRKRIARKLVEDATAVWILLESGNRRKDRTAADLLEKELRRLEQTLKLPDPDLWWGSKNTKDEGILKIQFDIVRLSRDDAGEEHLVNMLLNSEDDLKAFESEPMVFPVYGRGILLYAIVGKGINPWNIREAAEFLTGYCSCQAKVSNPGVDLLLSMDWDKQIENVTDLGISSPLSGMGDFRNKEEEARRRLDSALLKRLGAQRTRTELRETDPEKVVYLDISLDNKEKMQKTKPDAGFDAAADNNPAPEHGYGEKKAEQRGEKKPEQGMAVNQKLPDKDSLNASVETAEGKMDSLHILLFVFGGVMVLVLLGGTVLYKKNIT